MLINVKMPTIIVGILTFISMINFALRWVAEGYSIRLGYEDCSFSVLGFSNCILVQVIKVTTGILTLKAPIATKVVCFSRLLKCLRSLYDKQCGPRSDCSMGAVCSGSTLFASILNSSVKLGNYLQQTTSADNIFRWIFFLGLKG